VRLLVLGGGRQLGGALVSMALANGHEVTVFNRGLTNPGRFEGADGRLTVVRGDRDHDLAALGSGRWDSVVDTCAYTPSTLRTSLSALAGRVGHYAFVSTVTVYDPDQTGPIHEGSRLLPLEAAPPGETISLESYGFLKVRCEMLLAHSGFPSLIVRPGVITGPEDHTARLKFWVDEVAEQRDVIAPGTPDRVLQLVDSRDVSAWVLRAVEAGTTGVVNCVGAPKSFGAILQTCIGSLGRSDVRIHWRSPEVLSSAPGFEAAKWPLWNGGIDDRYDGTRAEQLGFPRRPFAETIGDVSRATRRSLFVLPSEVRASMISAVPFTS